MFHAGEIRDRLRENNQARILGSHKELPGRSESKKMRPPFYAFLSAERPLTERGNRITITFRRRRNFRSMKIVIAMPGATPVISDSLKIAKIKK